MPTQNIEIVSVSVSDLRPADYNPRKWDDSAKEQLKRSIEKFGLVDPIICNGAKERHNIIIGGHFRLTVAKEMGVTAVPVVYVHVADIEGEKELNLLLNHATGEFDLELRAEFDEKLLVDVGFTSEEIDDIFPDDENPEVFDLEAELKKLNIENVSVQKGDVYELNGSRLMCGDSTGETDGLKLFGDTRADMCLTDPPYLLDYLKGKKKAGEATEGFGLKRDRKYLETDVLPDNFTELWMANIAKIQKPDFSIIVYENPKNLRIIWNELEKHWKYRNTIVWHLPNRVQGFSAKYKFFSKT